MRSKELNTPDLVSQHVQHLKQTKAGLDVSPSKRERIIDSRLALSCFTQDDLRITTPIIFSVPFSWQLKI